MTMTIDKFQDILLYSNKNIEKLISKVVNESSNASLVSLYEDAAILLDHKKGNFYNSKYSFDAKNGVIVLEDFEQIELSKDTTSFKDAVRNYFDSELDISSLKEAYTTFSSDQEAFIDSIVSESLSEKNFNDLIDYSTLEDINEDVEIKNETFYKEYKQRLSSHPMGSVKVFNWKTPVVVSLLESESVKFVNKNAKAKAKELYKDSTFKSKANKALESLKEGNIYEMASLAEEYSQIFYLDTADRKTLFSKVSMGNSKLLEGRKEMISDMETLFNEDEDLSTIMMNYKEAAEEDDTETTDEAKDTPKELTPEESDKLVKELEKVLDKVEDEKLANKIEALIKALSDGKDTGTDIETVKESIEILSI